MFESLVKNAINTISLSYRAKHFSGFHEFLYSIISEKYLLVKPRYFSLSVVQIEPTTYCDLKCPSCISRFWNIPTRHMSMDEYSSILSKLPPSRLVILQGIGEPLLSPHIADMVALASRKTADVCIVTNGLHLTVDRAVELEKAGCTQILVSIDNCLDSLPRGIHSQKESARALSNVDRIHSSKRLSGTMEIGSFVVVNNASQNSLNNTIRSIDSAGIRFVRFEHQNEIIQAADGSGWMHGKPILGAEDASAIMNSASETIQKIGIRSSFGWRLRSDLLKHNWDAKTDILIEALGDRKLHQCRLPWNSVYITVQGFVQPCCFVPDPSYISFGNILKNSFRSIMNSDQACVIRKGLKEFEAPDFCKMCPCFVTEDD